MKRQDFLGSRTITVAAGIPPMGTIFTAVPPVVSRSAIDLQQGLPWVPSQAPAALPETLKIQLTPRAPDCGCSA
jgi:hypothetical protein